MKKKFITLLVACMCAFAAVAMSTSAFAAPGDSGEPHQISNCTQLQTLGTGGYAIDDYYVLTQDFSCDAIAAFDSLFYTCFEGNFDGQGYEVSDLHMITDGDDYRGMFACVDELGTVSNVGVTNVDIETENYYVGGLVGYNIGTIENSYATGTVIGLDSVGGLVGGGSGVVRNSYSTATVTGTMGSASVGGLQGDADNPSSEIIDSYATGDVAGATVVGGLVGALGDGYIEDSYATGNVEGVEDVGGLAGTTGDGGYIERSYATGAVYADTEVGGGFVGDNQGETVQSFATGDVSGGEELGGFAGYNGGVVSNSYARGNVSGTDDIGGFVGYRDCGDDYNSYSTGTVTSDFDFGGYIGSDDCGEADNLFWDIQTSGVATSDIGTGKTTAEMKDIATFTDTVNTDGLTYAWDFIGEVNNDNNADEIWTFVEGRNDDYPVFNWQTFEDPEEPVTSASTTQTPTGDTVIIEWDSDCTLNDFNVQAESVNTTQDIAFDYPNGLVNFSLESCEDSEVNIVITYVNVENGAFVLRKYLPTSGAYSTVEAATLAATTVDDKPAVQASYVIVDNGPLDTDPADGVISDPVGIAEAVVGAPRTGGGGTAQ